MGQELLTDETYMRLALQMAEAAKGQTGCNPVVGCVIVKEGRIVGMGVHLQQGEAHAEIHALQMAGAKAEGSTVYVTLEPCSHHGRTPPCANRLMHAKVARVVAACLDPNPLVAGRGLKLLYEHGVEVLAGVLEEEAVKLNEFFNTFITRKRPFITMKTASTLDGKIATYTGDSQWITNEAARGSVHMLRHQHQAIMVGVGTILADNPSLTARLPVPSLQPVRIIADSQLRTSVQAKVVQDASAETIILTTEQAGTARIAELEQAGVTVLVCGAGEKVDLPQAMQALAERDIASILLEGGGQLNGAMLAERLVDKMVLYYAPKMIGGTNAPGIVNMPGIAEMTNALNLERVSFTTYGDNLCLTGYPAYEGRGRHVYGDY